MIQTKISDTQIELQADWVIFLGILEEVSRISNSFYNMNK
jgi:hypothetical protein